MLRMFGWVVRFFDWLRVLDDRFEAIWLNKGWLERLTWWVAGSLAISVFAFLLVCGPGTVLLEINRFYHFIRTGTYPAVMHVALWTFAVGFAAVTVAIAFASRPLFTLQIRNRGPRSSA